MASRNKYRVTTQYLPVMLEVEIETKSPEKVWLTAFDEYNPNRKFTKRFKTITGKEKLWVRMPISPNATVIQISKDENGTPFASGAEIKSVVKKPLVRKLDPQDIGNEDIRKFLDFAQRFAYNMDELKTNQRYVESRSGGGEFEINYLDTIQDRNSGKELNTPSRIGRRTGIIEVSKKRMSPMTIPARVAILLHEFSHYYLNEKMDDEMEADINGLLIFLSVGYPRIDAYEAFLQTFEKTSTQQNKERYDHLDKFIREFEKMDMVIN